MCWASHEGSSDHGDSVKGISNEAYITEPFPELELEPLKWREILATLDVSVNDITPTIFCDEESYDIVPI